MLKWIRAILPQRSIANFKSDWHDGQNLLHLVHEIKPDKVPPVNSLDRDKALSNCKLAVRTAKTYLNVPVIIDPEILANGKMDELSMMTYLSYFVKPASKSVLRLARELLPKHKIDNLASDWSSGIAFAALLECLFPGAFPKWKDLPDNTPKKNLEKLVEAAHKYCDIEPPIPPADLASSSVDELSVMTYILRMIYASQRILPDRVIISGPGIKEAACGRNTFFLVDSTRAGPGDVSVNLQHSNEANVRVMSNKKTRGITKYSYTPKMPGRVKIDVMFSSTPVPESPFIFEVFDTKKICIIDRDSLVTNLDVGQTIKVCVDASSTSNGTLTARLVYQAHPPADAKITSTGKGVFTATVPLNHIGSPFLRFYWNKEEIRNCALQILVIDASSYNITQSSLKSTYLTFESVEFFIETNEALSFDPLKLTAITDGIHIPFRVNRFEDSKGLADFTPTLPGVYDIHVACLGKEIEGSPFSIVVVDPTKCVFESKPSKYMALNETLQFLISTSDAGIGIIEAHAENVSMLEIEVAKIDTFQYCVSVTPLVVGETVVQVTFCNVCIPESPFRVTVCDPSSFTLAGELVDTHLCITGSPVNLSIFSPFRSSIRPVVKVQGPTARYPVKLIALDDGSFSVGFTAWEIGEHSLEAKLGGFHIQNSPLNFQTEKTTSEVCSASGKGLQQAYSGIPAQFILFANKTGLIEANSIEVKIQNILGHAKCKVRARDNNDGTYNIAYLSDQPGSYLVYLHVLGKSVPGSPFRVNILSGPLSSKCVVHGKAMNADAFFKIGDPIEFKVNTSKAGSGSLQVNALGARGIQARVFITPKDYKGVQDIQIDPTKAGKYRIALKWGGQHIPHSPFYIKVFPGADPSKCKAYGPGLESAITREKSSFTIDTRDAGSGVLRVSMSGSVKIDVKPISSLDVRTLVAEYSPLKAGDHLISIKWSEKEIIGSPFRVRVAENWTQITDIPHTVLPDICEEEEDDEEDLMEYSTGNSDYVTTKKNSSEIPDIFNSRKKGGGYQREFETKTHKGSARSRSTRGNKVGAVKKQSKKRKTK